MEKEEEIKELEKILKHPQWDKSSMQYGVLSNRLKELKNMTEEKPYPAGHNWEGLTPSQVNEAYAKFEKQNEKEV